MTDNNEAKKTDKEEKTELTEEEAAAWLVRVLNKSIWMPEETYKQELRDAKIAACYVGATRMIKKIMQDFKNTNELVYCNLGLVDEIKAEYGKELDNE